MNLINLLQIYKTNFSLQHYGPKRDGGYVISKQVLEKCRYVVICDKAKKFRFEKEILQKFNNLSNIDFYNEGNGYDKEVEIPKQLNVINKKLDVHWNSNSVHINDILNKNNLFLNVDIEKRELDVLFEVQPLLLNNINMMVIEFHVYNRDMRNKMMQILNSFQNTFTIVHIHANNNSGTYRYKDLDIPKLLEITFINNKFITKKSKVNGIQYPIEGLDFKNVKDKEELKLSWIK